MKIGWIVAMLSVLVLASCRDRSSDRIATSHLIGKWIEDGRNRGWDLRAEGKGYVCDSPSVKGFDGVAIEWRAVNARVLEITYFDEEGNISVYRYPFRFSSDYKQLTLEEDPLHLVGTNLKRQ